ncbi:MAG TPA: acyl-CoA thioesterase [Ramlibacter sp.]|jgi:acyl-CoA thioesterase FadM|nr:acyl-CoA thioesterase [Ramlibacter sp.]
MRPVLAAIFAALAPRVLPTEPVDCGFRVMPWDVGIATFKSDRYFTVADLAQVDFAIRTGLVGPFLRSGIRWVSLAESARFERPLRLFQRYTVTTRVVCADDKHAYFSHRFTSARGTHAEVLVKMKFKKGSLTVRPAELLHEQPSDKTKAILALDSLGAP